MSEIKEESLLAESAKAKQFSLKLYWGVGIVVIVGALAFGLFTGDSDQVVPEVLQAKAQKGDIVLSISTTGRVVSMTDVDLFFPSQGILKEVLVTEGQSVKAGEVLAKQDTRDAGLAIAQAELALETAQKNVAVSSGNTGLTTVEAAAEDLARAKADLETMYADQAPDRAEEYKQALIKVSQTEDVYSNALHAVDVVFIIDTRVVPYSKGEMGERLDTIENYRTAESAYESFLDALETQKQTIDQAALEQIIADSVELGKMVNRALQAGINSLSDSEPYEDFTQSIIDSSLTDLQSHQTKVKAEILKMTELRDALSSLEADQQEDIADQLALIRSLELKVAAANQGVTSDETQVSQAKLALTAAQLKYENLVLRAPISGTVGPINFRVGEFVGTDKDTPVLSIVGAEGISVESYVEEADVAKVAVGQVALITFDAFDSVPFEGVVTFISDTPTIDGNGIVTYRMVVATEEADDRIRAGMTTYVDVITSGVRDVLVIPVAAVRPHDGAPSVQKESGEWVPVTTSFTDGKQVEVTAGLKVGDTVIYVE
ncbi:HlyD family efflux transporter periplasmic adaptor subunit [Candidatus Kaiserbacteria bacterium]|nr:HlyD family efflux transporter periplasmic adaptor subunit [Candidatus Kaiserbacteria bacterium]USN92266.1 MAG: HlyD family efflux transporter periplasmic adaptor subunit [Candidatus Nomurabacteria bacterium]